MSIDAVSTTSAPAAIGPYSQAIRANGFLFCSGQIALDPATGELVSDDVREQTERVMKNLAAVLAAGGSGWDRVVKVTIFLADMNDFAAVNAIYGRYFESLTPPARATVAVRTLPRNVAVEIDCIAVYD
ncbi:MAG: RidA family protein [Sandaracinus sp.]|nr:RidA family protein [Sandaracinus sp.]MCB9633028.1 RidA family protein [Sandaracinus sp.]